MIELSLLIEHRAEVIHLSCIREIVFILFNNDHDNRESGILCSRENSKIISLKLKNSFFSLSFHAMRRKRERETQLIIVIYKL